MEKRETQEYEIEDRGVLWHATVIWWSYSRGGRDRIEVNISPKTVDSPSYKVKFGVTDAGEHECVFQQNTLEDTAHPTRLGIKALSRFGWYCTNFTVDELNRREFDNVGPTLQYIDDALATIMGKDDTIVADHPFLLDMLEAGQTMIAIVNTLARPEYDDRLSPLPDDADVTPLEYLFDPEHRTVLRATLAREAKLDAYSRLVVPALANYHFDMDIDPESPEADADPTALAALDMASTVEEPDGLAHQRPPGFDGKRYGETITDED